VFEEAREVTSTKRADMAGLVMLITLILPPDGQPAQHTGAPAPAATVGRVRSENARLAALIQETVRRSITFRRMADAVDASDGLVYIEAGRCPDAAQACLVSVYRSGSRRMVRIFVNDRRSDREVMGFLGHELRHALEVLGNPRVSDEVTMRRFYFFHPEASRLGNAFETTAAIAAGNAVRAELSE
jgi:hypothetical protein